eukprot:scaffold127656_cov31-Tisochrysis_lutea.AAC.3
MIIAIVNRAAGLRAMQFGVCGNELVAGQSALHVRGAARAEASELFRASHPRCAYHHPSHPKLRRAIGVGALWVGARLGWGRARTLVFV